MELNGYFIYTQRHEFCDETHLRCLVFTTKDKRARIYYLYIWYQDYGLWNGQVAEISRNLGKQQNYVLVSGIPIWISLARATHCFCFKVTRTL